MSGTGDVAPVDGWPGRRLGLPPGGPGSIARPGRRTAALALDWAACLLISFAFLDGGGTATLVVFAVEQALFVALTGSSPGHRAARMRVVRLDGARPGALDALVRAVLICLVVPAVVTDVDQRGLHDRARGTALLVR